VFLLWHFENATGSSYAADRVNVVLHGLAAHIICRAISATKALHTRARIVSIGACFCAEQFII
jgi:hypothetical protein